jgi:Polyketide cyclase / dehydrase and lipid transport
MHTTVSMPIDGVSAADVFAHVDTLDRYPAWMRLVHRVEELAPDNGRPAWQVQLRARVGPFARSKQLRMVRTVHQPDHHVRFERIQEDGREHAAWILGVTIDDTPSGAQLVTELIYGGALWGSAILQRVLDDEIRRGKAALRSLVSVGDSSGSVHPSRRMPSAPQPKNA